MQIRYSSWNFLSREQEQRRELQIEIQRVEAKEGRRSM
jgi:hypothetical protein